MTQKPISREILTEQLPLIAVVLALGFAAAELQHGFLPGGDAAFPLAGVRVPVGHLIWMGFWIGYTMAVVGEAADIFALPYTISILQFASASVTPTTQLLTFLNPFGVLFGFRRNRQFNLDLAKWACLGGVLGGPFARITVLSDVKPFTFVVGLALVVAGVHLRLAAARGYRARETGTGLEARDRRARRLAPSGLPPGEPIATLARDARSVTIAYWGESGGSPRPR